MSGSKPTRADRRSEAREVARLAREKAERRRRVRRWLLPTVVSLGVVAVCAAVVVAVGVSRPVPPSEAGPRNMASGGIQFVGEAGVVAPVETPGIPVGGAPVEPDPPGEGVAHVIVYLDLSCPACKQFEEVYGDDIFALVAAGEVRYEVRPVAILDHRYQGSRYSTRANNVAACVADRAPESFLDVAAAMFRSQPSEGTPGLNDDEILRLVHDAGPADAAVDACIRDESFAPFVAANTDRATTDSHLRGPRGFSTPTLVVDGELWDRSTDPLSFIEAAISG